jgi:hypothetical protein
MRKTMALPLSTAQKMPGHYGDMKKKNGKKAGSQKGTKKALPASFMKNMKKKKK